MNSFATAAARWVGAGVSLWKAAQERQTGLATTAPRVEDTETDVGRRAEAQDLDQKAAAEQAMDICKCSYLVFLHFLDFFPFFVF